jgi:hypothetical protein
MTKTGRVKNSMTGKSKTFDVYALLRYYSACLESETLDGASFPSFDVQESFVSLPGQQEWSGAGTTSLPSPLPPQFVQSLGSSKDSLYYGWPCYVRPSATTDGKTYSWIDPLFLLKVTRDESSETAAFTLQRGWPRINERFLDILAPTLEERLALAESLGLPNAEVLPREGLVLFWRQLMQLYPDLMVIEEPAPAQLAVSDFSTLPEEGIYNRAILFRARQPREQRALSAELRALSELALDAVIPLTALGSLFGRGTPATLSSMREHHLLQITPLNLSQRQACQRTATHELTVITGPPGSGKTQSVINILADAFEKGRTVLFAGKNMQAVDVVSARLAAEASLPFAIRPEEMGAPRDILTVAEQLRSAGNPDTITNVYDSRKREFESTARDVAAAVGNLEHVATLRNKVDELERQYDSYQNRIPPALFAKVTQLELRATPLFKQAEAELEKARAGAGSLQSKVMGIVNPKQALKKLQEISPALAPYIGNLIRPPDGTRATLKEYDEFIRKALLLYEFIQFNARLTSARRALGLADTSKVSSTLEALEETYIERGKQYLEATIRYRLCNLKETQRKDLAQYHSLVHQRMDLEPDAEEHGATDGELTRILESVRPSFPVWTITSMTGADHLPLTPGLFDLVVFDEATQSDIASAIPLLFRAKRAVIIGGPQELHHRSLMSKPQDHRLNGKHGFPEEVSRRFSYSTQSLFDCALAAAPKNAVTLLNEHYRSHRSIIEFSNREWYEGLLDIKTNYPALPPPPDYRTHLEWIDVQGETTRFGNSGALNTREADKILEVIHELMGVYRDRNATMGVITPFSAQKEYLLDAISRKYPEQEQRRVHLLVGTAHQFQGDQRDIVLYSPVLSRNADKRTTDFLASTANLFNVAITRARSVLWVVGDRSACAGAGIPFLKKFTEYVATGGEGPKESSFCEFASPWETKLFEALTLAGFYPRFRYPAGPFSIGIAILGDRHRLAIEIDGRYWHRAMSGEELEREVVRDRQLRKMGWVVLRFWVSELRFEMNRCLKMIQEALGEEGSLPLD